MSGTFVPPHSSSRRAALLEQLIVTLTSGEQSPLPIKTRAPDDATIALLDAWATVGDVLGFYLDRIAEEGYLSTAVEPGSILSLAGLVGYQPAPSLAAQVHLAYTLAKDLADGAVQFDSGLLFQSVPAPGQQPQAFESVDAVVARPSWNLLTPKSSQPLQTSTTSLVVDSTTAKLSPNDVILLNADDSQLARFVESATVNYSAKVTNVTLQAPGLHAALPARPTPQPAGPTEGIDALLTGSVDEATTPGSPNGDLITTRALTSLPGSLSTSTTPLPASVNDPTQSVNSVYPLPPAHTGSNPVPDSVLRLLSALQPAVASTLYAAFGSMAIGSPPVTGASVMQVTAAPFGAAAPPQPVFNANGQPAGSRDWPIGDTLTLQLSVAAADFLQLLEAAFPQATRPWLRRRVDRERRDELARSHPVIDVQLSVAAFTSQATIQVSGLPADASPVPQGFGAVSLRAGEPGAVTLLYAGYTPPAQPSSASPPATAQLQVTASLSPTTNPNAVTLEFVSSNTNLGTLTWDPAVDTPLSGQVGNSQVTIAWATPPGGEAVLTLSVSTPLPLADRTVLRLDGNYSGITSGSPIVIRSADSPDADPVIATVQSASTVAASGFGITGKVTQLTLNTSWIDETAVLQSALRPLTVHAQPAALPLQPAPVTADVTGSSIDLDGLVAGMEPGRLIAVTGSRTDLPAQAKVQAGEIAMIASVSTGADGGDTPYSTLQLRNPLAFSYQRATVQIYGNVVSAHQGATINQVLGNGQPALVPQSFTLSSGPLLADPAATTSGHQSTLTVTVDGVGYEQVDRYDASTPAQSFLAGTNASGQTTIVFPSPLPAGTGNISASYRAGNGSQGNLQPKQITQLLRRPASLSSVTNPLAASGGTGGDDQESVRAAVPGGLIGLGRIVTVSDYAGLAGTVSGVGKASAALTPDGIVVVTVAGTNPVQLDRRGSLCSGVTAAIATVADPAIPVQILPASLYLITLTADVVRDPTVGWDATVAAIRSALLASFGYAQRDLGQELAVSELLAAAHRASGVVSFTVTGLVLVPAAASASDLSLKLPSLLTRPVPPVATLAAVPSAWGLSQAARVPLPAAVAYLSDAAPGTLILSEQSR